MAKMSSELHAIAEHFADAAAASVKTQEYERAAAEAAISHAYSAMVQSAALGRVIELLEQKQD